ncbi:1-phosphofructokinase family hexose kinase [Rathayibacter sp. VKM Ac-2857]|uniref:1-phosphofructokinase family hexose kinase n=1 Tax=Rathayibacter sp. VKM Ac-2857 TaxID=2739020 RepID=UPI0020B16FBF|nr:hexose kinase [Rathayibacter sp. VKM Ac-2857]
MDVDPISRTPVVAGRSRVVTLTPAPAIDRVYRVGSMTPGTVHRALSVETHLAGKGINVARTLRLAGNETVAIAPMNLEDAVSVLEDQELYRTVSVTAPTRVNTIVVAADGSTTNINQRASALDPGVWTRLCAVAGREIQRIDADWIVIAGSMPREAGSGATLDPAPVFAEARRAGARICLDSGDATLGRWIRTGFAPDLIKPNVHELAATAGRPLRTLGDVVDAARELVDAGVETVLASLGADGALAVTRTRALWARAPRADVVNTTGAGDAALAGFLSAWPDGDADRLETALAAAVGWGALAVEDAAPVLSAFRPVPGIEVGAPALHRALTDEA